MYKDNQLYVAHSAEGPIHILGKMLQVPVKPLLCKYWQKPSRKPVFHASWLT